MDGKNNRKMHELEEEEEESDGDDTVSLSDYQTDDQEQQLESSYTNNNNDYSFEFPFNGNATISATSVNLFGYSFDDGNHHNLTPSHVKSKSCRESYRPRQHKVLFGLAKIPTRMELTDIKKRQSRNKSPAPTFPVVAAGKTHASSVLVPSFKLCGVHLASVFSFGCVSRSRV